MPVNDELLDQWREDHDDLIGDLASALGTAVGADDSDEANDYVTDLTNAVVPIVRAAVAAQPQPDEDRPPLFEGTLDELAQWIRGDFGVITGHVVVYLCLSDDDRAERAYWAAVAGSATPTETEE